MQSKLYEFPMAALRNYCLFVLKNTVLEVRDLEIKVSAVPVHSGGSRRESISCFYQILEAARLP